MARLEVLLTNGVAVDRQEFGQDVALTLAKPAQDRSDLGGEAYAALLWESFHGLPRWVVQTGVRQACKHLVWRPQPREITDFFPIEYRRLQAWKLNLYLALVKARAAAKPDPRRRGLEAERQARLACMSAEDRARFLALEAAGDFAAAARISITYRNGARADGPASDFRSSSKGARP